MVAHQLSWCWDEQDAMAVHGRAKFRSLVEKQMDRQAVRCANDLMKSWRGQEIMSAKNIIGARAIPLAQSLQRRHCDRRPMVSASLQSGLPGGSSQHAVDLPDVSMFTPALDECGYCAWGCFQYFWLGALGPPGPPPPEGRIALLPIKRQA